MRKLFFFSVLAGALLLASCQQKENFAPKTEAGSAISFTVYKEVANTDTKASFTEKMRLNIEEGDLMSLYHGVVPSVPANVNEETLEWLQFPVYNYDFTGYSNAIYKGASEDGSAVSFTTQAMVKRGGAILVYPADTTFVNDGTSNPFVTIKTQQTAQSNLLLPFASNLIWIYPYNGRSTGEGSQGAGYGRNYPIVLKQIGSTLKLELRFDQEKLDRIKEVSDFYIKSVSLKAQDLGPSKGVFTTKVSLIPSVERPVKNGGKTKHSEMPWPQWTNQIEVEIDETSTAETISTTDIEGLNATFSLLPSETPDLDSDNVSVLIETNIGNIELNSNPNEGIWYKGEQATAIAPGLEDILRKTWIRNKSKESNFYHESTGAAFNRAIDADLDLLDMDHMHFQTSQQLIEAFKVYNIIKPKKNLKWFLDGDFLNYGEFDMTEEALDLYIQHYEEYYAALEAGNQDAEPYHISFYVEHVDCDYREGYGPAFAINMKAEKEREVPEFIIFGDHHSDDYGDYYHSDDPTQTPPITKATPDEIFRGENSPEWWDESLSADWMMGDPIINFIGEWKWTNRNKIVGGKVHELNTPPGSIMNFGETVGIEMSSGFQEPEGKNADYKYRYTNHGTVNVRSDITMLRAIAMSNVGVINIPEGKELRVNSKLVNLAYLDFDKTKANNGSYEDFYDVYSCGYINVSGNLVCTVSGYILNIGRINQLTAEALVYITENEVGELIVYDDFQETYFDIKKPWQMGTETPNAAGHVCMFDFNNKNVSVANKNYDGFIIGTINKEDVEAIDFGTQANTIILKGAKSIDLTVTPEVEQVLENNLSRITYLIIDSPGSHKVQMRGEPGNTLWMSAIVVIPGTTLDLLIDQELEVDYIYNKGEIYCGGDLSVNTFVGYFGGNDNDRNRVLSYGGID